MTDVEYFFDKSGDKVTAGTDNIENYLEKKYEKDGDELLTRTNIIGTDGKYKLKYFVIDSTDHSGSKTTTYILDKTAPVIESVELGNKHLWVPFPDEKNPF